MNKNLKLILAATIATSFVASAHQTTRALVNSSGMPVKNSHGQCVESKYAEENTHCGAAKPKPPVKPQVVTTKFSLGAHALFSTNKYNLRTEGKKQIQELVAKIKEGTELGQITQINSINVVGYTDSRGTAAYNQGLSERRAASVANYMVKLGIPASILNVSGDGENNPVATNDTAAGRQKNRRVDISVTGLKK